MSEPIQVRRRVAVRLSLLAAGGLVGVLLWSGTLSNSEALLLRGYQAALAETDTTVVGMRLTPAALSDGTEHRPVEALWPGKPDGQSLAFRRPFLVGDRITIASRDGKPERLAVIELRQVDGASMGAPGVRFQLVTSRIEGAADGDLVRFLIAIAPDDERTPSGDKTL